MGQVGSCLQPGPSPGTLRTLIENGNCQALLSHFRQRPELLVAPVFSGENTVLHVACRYGETAIVSALFDLLDELHAEEQQVQQRLAREAAAAALAAEADTLHVHSAHSAAAQWRDGCERCQASAGGQAPQLEHRVPVAVWVPVAPVMSDSEVLPAAQQSPQGDLRVRSGSSASTSSPDKPTGAQAHLRTQSKQSKQSARASAAAVSLSAGMVSLPQRADVANACNKHSQTPLHVAASRGHADIVMLLLQMGADLWRADKIERCTALHYAAMNGHTECVRALLVWCSRHHQPSRASVQTRPSITLSSRQPSPLTGVGSRQSPGGTVSGASPPQGTTAAPLTGAVAGAVGNPSDALSRAIPAAATSVDGSNSNSGAGTGSGNYSSPLSRLVNMLSASGATALHFAADAGHTEVTRLLCSHSADINMVMCPERVCWLMLHHGATALHLAAEQGHLGVALAILRHYQENYTRVAGLTDPRDAQDRSGLRPHQLAFLTHNFRVALVIRPGFPLRWLFEPTPGAGGSCQVPTLAALAGAALRSRFCTEIDALQQQQQQAASLLQKEQQRSIKQQHAPRPLPQPHGKVQPRLRHKRAASMVVAAVTGVGASGGGSSRAASTMTLRLQQLGTTRAAPAAALTSSTNNSAHAASSGGANARGTPGAAGDAAAASLPHSVDAEAVFRARASSPVQDLLDVDTIRQAAGLEPLPAHSSLRASTGASASAGAQQAASAVAPGGEAAAAAPLLAGPSRQHVPAPHGPLGPSVAARWAQQRSNTASPVPALALQASASPLRLGGFATAALSLADHDVASRAAGLAGRQEPHEEPVVQTARGVELHVHEGPLPQPEQQQQQHAADVRRSNSTSSLGSSIGSGSSGLSWQCGVLDAQPEADAGKQRDSAGAALPSGEKSSKPAVVAPQRSGPAVLSKHGAEGLGEVVPGAVDGDGHDRQVQQQQHDGELLAAGTGGALVLGSDEGEEAAGDYIMEEEEEAEEAEEVEQPQGQGQQVVEVLDDDVCDVCFEDGPRLMLRPCGHEVCVVCARRLCAQIVHHPATCPFCRGNIRGFAPAARVLSVLARP